MIVIDLEWNQGHGFGELEEIIQLSAVRISALGGKIEDSFNAYIKPTLYKKFSVGAKKLPDLELSITSENDFRAVYQSFLSWCSEETAFAAWGGQDFGVLERNAAFHELPAPRMELRINLQAAFGRTVGTDRCLALESAVAYCAIPEIFSYHNALNDAMYTALVSGYIDAEAIQSLAEEKAHKRKKMRGFIFTEASPDMLPDALSKQFTQKQHGLNSRVLRCAPCSVCGKYHTFALWYPFDQFTYYGVAVCGEHGRTLCRLSLKPHKHCWLATRTVLAATETEIDAYRTAREHEPFHATATKSQRKSHRRKYYIKKNLGHS